MIESEELRIGNLVFYKGKVEEVCGLNPPYGTPCYDDDRFDDGYGDMSEGYKDAEGNYKYHRAEPIPLTIEWLDRCGFSLTQDEEGIQYYSREDCPIDFQAEAGSDKFEQVNPLLSYKLEYVHQLQNLYFALSGTELEIKPL